MRELCHFLLKCVLDVNNLFFITIIAFLRNDAVYGDPTANSDSMCYGVTRSFYRCALSKPTLVLRMRSPIFKQESIGIMHAMLILCKSTLSNLCIESENTC